MTLTYRTPAGGLRTTSVTLSTRPGAPREGFLGVSPKGTPTYPAPWRAAGQAVAKTMGIVVGDLPGAVDAGQRQDQPGRPQRRRRPGRHHLDVADGGAPELYPALLAFISVNLGIINLLPFLPFDGGHIFFNVMESVRGRRVDPRVLERAIAIGVVVLVTLFILLTYNDLNRIFHIG